MKRYLYLFPLMAFTAATLTLGACDDKKKEEDQTQADQTTAAPADTTATTAPDANNAMTATTPTTATAAAVQAEGANAYATASGATTGAVFLTLHNSGTDADKLTGVKTDAATTAEIHESFVDDQGTMQMRKVDDVEVGGGQQVTLKPDGYHIMLMGLTKPLVEGETFKVTLTFEKAPEVTLPVTITAAGTGTAAPAATDTMDHSTMDNSSATTDTATPAPDAAMTPSTSESAPSMDESPAPAETTTSPDAATPPSTTSDAPGTTTDSTPSDTTDGNGTTAQ